MHKLEGILKEPSVVFNDKSHTYRHKKTNDLYTGCTTVSDLLDKPFLGPWYAKEATEFLKSKPFDEIKSLDPESLFNLFEEAKGAASRIGQKAMKDGREAHDFLEKRITYELTKQVIPSVELSREANNAVAAFTRWTGKKNIEWLASEQVVSCDKYRIGGRLDALAKVNDKLSLLDFKVSSQLSESYPLQCAGYDIMLQEMGLTVEQYIILRLPKTGTDAETLTISSKEEMELFRNTFLHLREAHKYQVYIISHYKDKYGRIKVDQTN